MTPATRLSDSDRALLEALLRGLDRLVPILEVLRDVFANAERDQARELAAMLTRLECLVDDVRDEVDELSDAVGV